MTELLTLIPEQEFLMFIAIFFAVFCLGAATGAILSR